MSLPDPNDVETKNMGDFQKMWSFFDWIAAEFGAKRTLSRRRVTSNTQHQPEKINLFIKGAKVLVEICK